MKTNNIISFVITCFFAGTATYAAPADEEPALKGSINKSINIKSGSGNYSIIWDAWRNNVMKAVWAKFCILLEGGDAIKLGPLFFKLGVAPKPQFPQGTGATFEFTVTKNKKITNVKITNSSGRDDYDGLVKKSIESLEGKRILEFPDGTNRDNVGLGARLVTKRNGKFHQVDYNDIEKVKGAEDTVELRD